MIADIAHKLTTGSLIALTLYYTAFMGSRGADIVQGTCNRFHAAVVDEKRKSPFLFKFYLPRLLPFSF